MRKPWLRRALILAATPLVALAGVALPAAANTVGSGTHPWAVVLCNFTNQRFDPADAAYFNRMYGDAGAGSGQYNLEDYWHDVSFGRLSAAGTRVVTGPHADSHGWYTVNETRDAWGYTKNRFQKIADCASAAVQDVDFSQFWGVHIVFPEAAGNVVNAISATDTHLTISSTPTNPPPGVDTTNYWPAAPFMMNIDDGTQDNGETVTVTAVNGADFTISRGSNGTTAKAHNAQAGAGVPGDYGAAGIGQTGVPLADGRTYQLGLVIVPNQNNITGSAHETGHGYGYDHSRKISYSTTDYQDSTDSMSSFTNTYETTTLGTFFGGSVLGSPAGSKGPGLTSIQLDKQGWIPAAKHFGFDNSAPNQSTLTLHSLGDPDALSSSDYLEARVPANVQIENVSPSIPNVGPTPPTNPPTCTGTGYACIGTQYYTIEYRQATGWDSAFPQDAVVLHLLGDDGRPYWVDGAGSGGLLGSAGEFADANHGFYLFVNSASGKAAQVTVASRKIAPTLTVHTDVPAQDYHDDVLVSGDLKQGDTPLPFRTVTLSVGNQTCDTLTDAAGHASCTITLDQQPGPVGAAASYAGDDVFTTASASAPFTVQREETTTAYTGDLKLANGTPAHLSGALKEDGTTPITGRTLTLSVGSGASQQSCTGVTDANGSASCTIPSVAQPLGGSASVPVSAAFAGDAYYLPSNASATAVLNYLTGRAFGLSADIKLLLLNLTLPPQPDTGQIRSADPLTTTTPCAASVDSLLITAHGLCPNVTVTTAPGKSVGTSTVQDVSIGIPGLPVIKATAIKATATTTCSAATGAVSISSLTVAGVPVNLDVAPNTSIDLGGGARLLLNEQIPVAGADHGLTVNALHLTVLGKTVDVVVGSATSDIHNC